VNRINAHQAVWLLLFYLGLKSRFRLFLFKGGLLLGLACVVLACLPDRARGAGFALVQQGTAAMAQGNAFVAEAHDPSAIYYNPAGLNQLTRPEFYTCTVINYPNREFFGTGDYWSETSPRFYDSGAFYLAVPFNPRVAVGLGFFAPFGLGSNWPAAWQGRYITTYSRLKTYNLNPVISVKLLDNLSLAGGVNFLWSDVRLRKRVPFLPGQDGESDLVGTGHGLGGNFGLLWEPLTGIKFGLSYRSQIFVLHRGHLHLNLPVTVPGVPRVTDGTAKLTYPQSLTFGVSVSRLAPFTFNVDITWTGWSSYDRLAIRLEQPVPVNGVPATQIVTEKNWHDAWAFRFGVGYQLKENLKLRAGYTLDLTPVPSSTLEPQVPDANRHILAVGGEMKVWRLTLGLAYNFILFEDRKKDNRYAINGVPLPPAFQVNGRYRSHVHSLGLSSSIRF